MEDFFRLSRSIVKSPSFNPKNVGVWKQYFEEPTPEVNQMDVLETRLRSLLTLAFRRPVEDRTLQKYFSYAEAANG